MNSEMAEDYFDDDEEGAAGTGGTDDELGGYGAGECAKKCFLRALPLATNQWILYNE